MKPVLNNSSGMCAVFPDTCKTPSPGGPVPIPYPNIVQDGDGAGSNKVTIENKQTLRKGDSFRMSSGDEAGTAGGGIMSSRIKGAGEIKKGCSTVKAQGKDVAYLLVTVGHNGGSRKNAPTGKAVKPGQLKVVLKSVRGKKRKVTVKVRKFKPGETNVAPDTATNNAAAKVGNAKTTADKIKASEAMGDAGARNAITEMAKPFGGVVGKVVSLSGSGVLDVIAFTAKGTILVLEAKGGSSALGTRVTKQAGRCLQGTKPYLRDIVNNMRRSKNPEVRALGKKLAKNFRKIKYFEARTRATRGKPAKARPTRVREFDPKEIYTSHA